MLSDIRTDLIRTVDSMRDEIVDFTADLIRFPTVNPPGEKYAECSEFIAKKLRTAGLKVEVLDVPKEYLVEHGVESPRYCVLGRWTDRDERPAIHVNGHYDVVPAGSGWTVPPFDGVVRDSKIYGRGASDMKGGISSSIMAVCALERVGFHPKGTLLFSATPDEEIGGQTGVGYMVEKGLARADMAILCETGGVDKYTIAYRGALWLEIRTIGKTAHGGRPHEGVNAIEKMAKVLVSLMEMKSSLSSRRSKAPITPEESRHPTLNIGLIRGGVKANVVADECAVTIDRRLIHEETIDQTMREIHDLLDSLAVKDRELKISVKRILSADPAYSSESSALVQALTRNIRQIVQKEPTIRFAPSFSDFRFFATRMSIPTVNYGPGVGGHVADEYVSIPDLVTATKVLALTLMDLLQGKTSD